MTSTAPIGRYVDDGGGGACASRSLPLSLSLRDDVRMSLVVERRDSEPRLLAVSLPSFELWLARALTPGGGVGRPSSATPELVRASVPGGGAGRPSLECALVRALTPGGGVGRVVAGAVGALLAPLLPLLALSFELVLVRALTAAGGVGRTTAAATGGVVGVAGGGPRETSGDAGATATTRAGTAGGACWRAGTAGGGAALGSVALGDSRSGAPALIASTHFWHALSFSARPAIVILATA